MRDPSGCRLRYEREEQIATSLDGESWRSGAARSLQTRVKRLSQHAEDEAKHENLSRMLMYTNRSHNETGSFFL